MKKEFNPHKVFYPDLSDIPCPECGCWPDEDHADDCPFRPEKEPAVELVATGYEWTCPECESLNRILGFIPHVTCANCSSDFETILPSIAWGK
jgi:hypothetical protein